MRYPTPEEWLKLIEEFRTSGLTQKEFVAKHEIHYSTFQYWLYRKSKPVRIVSKSSPSFLPVEVVASPALKARAAMGVIELATASGAIIRCAIGTDTRYLAELVAALG